MGGSMGKRNNKDNFLVCEKVKELSFLQCFIGDTFSVTNNIFALKVREWGEIWELKENKLLGTFPNLNYFLCFYNSDYLVYCTKNNLLGFYNYKTKDLHFKKTGVGLVFRALQLSNNSLIFLGANVFSFYTRVPIWISLYDINSESIQWEGELKLFIPIHFALLSIQKDFIKLSDKIVCLLLGCDIHFINIETKQIILQIKNHYMMPPLLINVQTGTLFFKLKSKMIDNQNIKCFFFTRHKSQYLIDKLYYDFLSFLYKFHDKMKRITCLFFITANLVLCLSHDYYFVYNVYTLNCIRRFKLPKTITFLPVNFSENFLIISCDDKYNAYEIKKNTLEVNKALYNLKNATNEEKLENV